MEDLRILLSGEWNNHSETEEKQGWYWSASSSSDEMGNLYQRSKFPTANVSFISCFWAEPPFCQHPWIKNNLHNIFVTASTIFLWPPKRMLGTQALDSSTIQWFSTAFVWDSAPLYPPPPPPSSLGENWHMAMVQWAKHQSVCRGYLNMQTTQHRAW